MHICEVYESTQNVAEGIDAAALAGAVNEVTRLAGCRIALVLTGGYADPEVLANILSKGRDR